MNTKQNFAALEKGKFIILLMCRKYNPFKSTISEDT